MTAMQTLCFYNLLCVRLMYEPAIRENIKMADVWFIYLSVIWILWLFHTKVGGGGQITVYHVGTFHSVLRLQRVHSVSGLGFTLFLWSQKFPPYGVVCTLGLVAYTAMISAAQNIKHWMAEWLWIITGKDVEGCGRKWKWSKWSTILEFA
jgi:hypothetical protein